MKSNSKTLSKSSLNCLWAFFITAGLILLVYWLYGVYPLGEKCILQSDMQEQYYPFLTEFYSRIKEGRSLVYSWNTGFGMPFAGNVINYLSSPVNLIVLFFKKDNIYTAIALIILIKVSFASGFFTYYIDKSQNTDRIFAVGLGVAYSLCGWFAGYYWNFMWLDAFALFPLVIYGIERIIDSHKPLVYIVSLALSLITSYYIGYMICIFSVLWFMFYEFCIGKYSDMPVRHKNGFFSNLKSNYFVRDGLLFAFSSIIAAGIAAFTLVPVAFILTRSSATSDSWPENFKLFFRLFDFLVNHLADIPQTFHSHVDNVGPTIPNIYCGILSIILSIFFFMSKKITRREKWGFGLLLVILYFSMNLNVLNFVWHAFHFPNDLPYRFSFMYSFLLLVMSAKAFGNIEKGNLLKIALSSAFIILIALLANKCGTFGVDDSSVIISIVAVVIYCLLLAAYIKFGSLRDSVTLLIVFCMIIEVAYSGSGNYDIVKKQAEISENYDKLQTAITKVNSLGDDEKFYRSVLSINWNDGSFGYNGINTFSSMEYEKTAKVQSDLGLEGNHINSFSYFCQTPVYNMMHGIKYFNGDERQTPYQNAFGYSEVTDGLYRNDFYLPLAFAVNESIMNWEISDTDALKNQSDWFSLSTNEASIFEPVNTINVSGENIKFVFDNKTGKISYKKLNNKDGALHIQFRNKPGNQYYSYLYFDEAYAESYNLSEAISISDKNENSTEKTITIGKQFKDNGSIYIHTYCLNEEKLKNGYDFLKKNSMVIEVFDDTYIKGTVKADSGQIIYTSIPYDKGWKISIDGKALPDEDYIALQDAYLCFRMPEGNHTVEFTYHLRGLTAGIIISVISLSVLAAYYLLRFLRKKQKI